MKQTKKLNVSQHKFLQKHGVDTTGCRLVSDTKDSITYLKPDGEIVRVWKGDRR